MGKKYKNVKKAVKSRSSKKRAESGEERIFIDNKNSNKGEMLIGTLSKHRRGFGFVTPLSEAEIAELLGLSLAAADMQSGQAEDPAVGSAFKQAALGASLPEGDIFVPAASIGSAMDGDIVEIRLVERRPYGSRYGGRVRGGRLLSAQTAGQRQGRAGSPGGSLRGEVVRVIRRKLTEVVGTLECSSKFGFVVPERKRITEDVFVEKKNFHGAKRGDKVVAVITKYPESGHNAEGKITEIIARADEPGGDIKALIRAYGLSEKFPPAAQEEARALSENAVSEPFENGELAAAGIQGKAEQTANSEVTQEQPEQTHSSRRDLRKKKIITIDGADSKDFDDAVSIETLENGNYLLGVHIADVSHYVKEDSPLDREAAKRGNSVYLLNKVVPMLPEELSNGICSLNPGEDRLTLSVDMEFTPAGELVNHEIYESVICSAARMVYTDVSDMLEWDPAATQTKGEAAEDLANEEHVKALLEKYDFIYPDLQKMAELAAILRKKRQQRGSLDFDIAEPYICLDEGGKASEIKIAERRTANKLIEEFMLAANETVAEHFRWMELPFVYRVHEKPDVDKIEEFRVFAASFGLTLKGAADNIHPRALSELLEKAADTPYENIINTVLLRSMKKAYYDTECLGHFGLGTRFYCHFTSPIRRYPDLMIHRIIKEALLQAETAQAISQERIEELKTRTREASEVSSRTERVAQELEREVEKLKKAEYMEKHLGESFEGVVSGVTAYGMYVQLPNTVEGLVGIASLDDDYYDYEPEKYRLIGRLFHKTYSLGDIVRVELVSVSMHRREIDFILDE